MNPNRGLHSKLFVNLYLAFTFFVHCGQFAEVDKLAGRRVQQGYREHGNGNTANTVGEKVVSE